MAITDDIPKSRITLTYRTEVQGELESITLPFRVLIMGDLSNKMSKDRKVDLDQRQIRSLDGKNLDKVIADMNMVLELEVANRINPQNGGSQMKVSLPITSMRSFSPAEIAQNVPKIKALLLLKKLLLEAQANLDNRKEFRKLLRDLASKKENIEALQQQLSGFENFRLPERSASSGNDES